MLWFLVASLPDNPPDYLGGLGGTASVGSIVTSCGLDNRPLCDV